MTEYAGADFVLPALNQFCNPFGVSKELTGKACAVDSALSDSLGSDLRVHSARADNRDIAELLNVFDVA